MEIVFDKVSLVINQNTPLQKTLLNDISFKLDENLIYSFVGPSNSGKSSIADLICGLVKPTKGVVRVGEFLNDGRRIKKVNNLRSSIGYVYKNKNSMFFNKKVLQELSFGMKYFKYKNDISKIRSEQALKIVGLSKEYLNKNIDDLNVSEIKKVSIACVLVFNPKVIIFDEPTIGLNNKEKNDLIRIIRLLKNKYNKTIILLSKNVDFVYSITDKVFLLNSSRLINEGDRSLLVDNNMLANYGLDCPDIVRFTNFANKKNAKLEYYTDIKDLIKGVYRSVH